MLGIPSRFGWPSAGAQAVDTRRVLVWATALLLGLLAIQSARLVWILASPPGGVGQPAVVARGGSQADLTILSRFDAFFRGGPQGPIMPAPDTSAGSGGGVFQLFGVRAGGGGTGSAIIAGPDGRQVSVAVGETIADGAVLVSVGSDFAIIRNSGREERLEFSSTPAPPLPPAASPVQAARPGAPSVPSGQSAATGVPNRTLVGAIGLQPRRIEGRVRGFTLIPRGDISGLAAAGLRAGDVILTVNGLEVTVENQAELLQDLRQAPQAVVGFERNGQPMSVTLGNPNS